MMTRPSQKQLSPDDNNISASERGEQSSMKRRIIGKFKQTQSVKLFAISVMAIASLCFSCPQTAAQQPATQTSGQSAAQKYFTDVLLVNQNGEKMRLYSDLLKDKVVIIDFFFATCQGVCLPLNRNLQKVQEALGDRVGKDVHIISITVDPALDTAPKLKEYAAKLNARPGWYFLTGDKENVEFALRKLGGYVDDKQNHTNIFIIGNERTGLWKKAFGLAQSDELIKVVNSVLNDQPTGGK
jgi:protein SCO1/2